MVLGVLGAVAATLTVLEAVPDTVSTYFAALAVALAGGAGWAAGRSLQRPDGLEPRFDTEANNHWTFGDSANPDRLDAELRWERKFTVRSHQLDHLSLSWAPTSGDHGNFFNSASPPSVRIERQRLPDGKVATAEPAHTVSPAKFGFRLRFSPPLERDDEVELVLRIVFPQYRVRSRAEHVSILEAAGLRKTDLSFSSLTVRNRSGAAVLSAFLPDSSGMVPEGFAVYKQAVQLRDEELRLDRLAAYNAKREVRDAGPGWLVTLSLEDPKLASYRLNYRLTAD